MGSDSLAVALLTYRGSPYSGGQGVYVSHLSRCLVEQGHEVDVLSGPPYPELDEQVNLIKIPALNYSDRDGWFPRPDPSRMRERADWMEWWGTLTGGFPEPRAFGRRIVSYLREHADRYDLVHDNQSLCDGLLDVMDLGLPVVASLHHPPTIDRDGALTEIDGRVRRWLVRRHYDFTDMQKNVAQQLPRLITGSRQTRQDIFEEYGVQTDRVSVIPYGVDVEVFRPLEEIERDPNRLVMVGSSGWLCQTKGFPVLLEAYRSLKENYPQLELVVVGSPDDTGFTELDLVVGDLAERVAFLEEIPTGKVARLYNRASVVVVPSLYEGFGLPAAEAMACGTPVVASRAGGLPEVVGEAGVLVPPGDPETLAEGIRDLLEDPEKRSVLGERGRERVKRKFNWEHTARRTAEVYRETIDRFRSPGDRRGETTGNP